MRVRPEGVKKGQEWKEGTVIKQTNPRAYDVLVKGKLLKRNRVQLSKTIDKPAQTVTKPKLVKLIYKIQPCDTTTQPKKRSISKPTVQPNIIQVKRTRSGRLVKVPARYH